MNRTENLDSVLRQLMTDCAQQYAIPASIADKQRLMRALMNIRQPIPASESFLAAQDQELQSQAEEKGIVKLDGNGLLLWQGNITRLKVDAIVNAANSQMLGCWVPLHNCIDNCIHSAAGIQLRQECNELMKAQGHDEQTGQAKITLGYNLPAKHVIHTVGPIIPQGSLPTKEQEELLASCYRSCLDIADSNHLQSIAFCCISTGVFNFPNQRAAEIAITTVKQWIAAHKASSITQIVFNVFLDKDYDIYRRLMADGYGQDSTIPPTDC
ncbi:protein-ADP-ribose hydrolase [Proteiniphilum sp. X52]|nr:protein-ADP-ribose hydrolase [Proteiniphilum sp. X52]